MVGIDNSTSVTSKFTAKTLAESLYSNTALNVGNNAIILPNVIAQFVGNSSSYLQTNLQNKTSDGSADHVITADVGTDERNYIDLGIHGSTSSDAIFTSILPLDGYLFVQGNTATSTGGNLIIGTTTTGRTVNIIAGGPGSSSLQVKISTDGVNLVAKPLKFADGSSQNTSTESTGPFANSAFVRANSSFGVANSSALYANGAFAASNSASLYANAAFAASNSASLYANGAFEASNSASSYANSGFGVANSASLYANGAFIQANAVFSRSNNQVWPQANAAFGTANSGSLYANAAFIQANAAFSQSNNQVWPQANAAFNSSNTVGVYANAAFGVANSASLYANGAFTSANVATSAALYANGAFGAANSAGQYANSAFINSNNAYTTANSSGIFAIGAFGAANSAGQYANAAFSKANTAQTLAATQAGRLDVVEPIAQEAFTIAYAALDLSTANSGAWLPSKANAASVFANGAFINSNNAYTTANSASLYANGAFDAANSASLYANGAFSKANTAQTLAAAALANTSGAIFDGNLIVSGLFSANNGYTFKPRLPVGDQTTITIDYATDSMIKANLVADLTVSHSNFISGKVVELWLVNSSGTQKTITHGISALNSTVHNTTFNMPASSCAHLRYFVANGDLANTFVKVSHA